MKDDFPLPEGPKRITLQRLILEDDDGVKYNDFSVNSL